MSVGKIKNYVGGLRLEALAYKRRICSTRAEYEAINKFYIFGQGRSGSTLLTDLLNNHSEIQCDGEILYHKRLFPRSYVRAYCLTTTKPCYGFKVKPYQLTRDQKMRNPQGFLAQMAQDGWKMIYLYRSNFFRHALSGSIARARDLWHTDGKGKLQRVALDPLQVEEAVREKIWMQDIDLEMIRNLDYLNVEYDSDLMGVENQQRTVARICEHIGVPAQTVQTSLKPTTSGDLSETITNLDEICAHLKAVGYEKHVPEGCAWLAMRMENGAPPVVL